MNAQAQEVLESFDQLPKDDQQEVARAILCRTADFDPPRLSDETLSEQAEELFLELDRAETTHAKGP